LAGAVAGFSLGIQTEVTFPKGYRQRNIKGYDHDHTKEEIFEMIRSQSVALKNKEVVQMVNAKSPRPPSP
jgi:hypothetical protein